MDYSNFSLAFLVKNDKADYILPKLPNSMNELANINLSNPHHRANPFNIAIENNCVKSFDILFQHLNQLSAFSDYHYKEYFRFSVKSVKLHGNRYFAERILDNMLINYSLLDYNRILEIGLKIRYDLVNNKESKKINRQLKESFIRHIITHPHFKFIDYLKNGFHFYYELSSDIIKQIMDYSQELGISRKTFLEYLPEYITFNPSLLKLTTKSDLIERINFLGIEMKFEEMILIINNRPKSEVNLELTKENEESLVEIFKQILLIKNNKRIEYFWKSIIFVLLFFPDRNLTGYMYSDFNNSDYGTFISTLLNTPNKKILKFFINHFETNMEKSPDEFLTTNQKILNTFKQLL